MDIINISPKEIENKSFEIIAKELEGMDVVINGDMPCPKDPAVIRRIIMRCIHTTADFDYAKTMLFSDNATQHFGDLIRDGATIVTDTAMALAGINKRVLSEYGCKAVCYMSDADVAKEASRRNITRASVSMEHAMKLDGPVIFAIGNAPTALITLKEHYDARDYVPAFVIGVPVGFVNVVASKEMIKETDIPYIINSGRKGGSGVAAAIVNAMLYSLKDQV